MAKKKKSAKKSAPRRRPAAAARHVESIIDPNDQRSSGMGGDVPEHVEPFDQDDPRSWGGGKR